MMPFIGRLRSAVGGPRWLLNKAHRNIRRGIVYARAWWKRRTLSGVTFIGITGSAGKTTTKDLTAALLSALGPCARTERTANEHIHVAGTIASVTRSHHYCVVEISASGPGYLDFPVALLKPNIAVLTLIAREHFQAFRSIEAIAEEKSKLVMALPTDGTAVLNVDDPLVRAIGERCACRVIWIGQRPDATLRLREVRSRFPEALAIKIEYQGTIYEVRTQLHGTQLALSVVAALAVGLAVGMPLDRAIEVIAQVASPEGRMQVIAGDDGVVFLRDDWKAPYWSLQAPFQFMRDAEALRKVVVIGTVSDYSLSASKVYPKIAKQALEVADLVVFTGPHALRALKGRRDSDAQRLLAFPELRDAAAHLRAALRAGDLVLLKGSNKADHLVRIMLDRAKPVQCWKVHCGLPRFCGRCDRLYQPIQNVVSEGVLPAMDTIRRVPMMGDVAGAASHPATCVIVGLGNPGDHFANTPHNVGYRALDALAQAAGSGWVQQPEGLVSTITIGEWPVKLLKPGLSMNFSGSMVRRLLEGTGSNPDDCIIVHDDMDLALGAVRLKRDGGDAGHKGVRSIVSELGTGTIKRIRIGVRRTDDARKAAQVVLSEFSAADETLLGAVLEQAADMARNCVRNERALSGRTKAALLPHEE